MEEKPDKKSDLNRHLKEMTHPGAMAGITFALSIGLMAALGYWLDGLLGTSPWLMIVFLFVGAVSGFIHLVETVSPGTLFSKRKGSSR